jgi:hypothetical protein
MTASQFRKIAFALSGVEERAHMGHPDFRAGGKIFATLGYPDNDWGMVALTPEQQEAWEASRRLAAMPQRYVLDRWLTY